MPTNLTGSTIASTYAQLLHVDGGPIATEKTVYSGTGVATALKVGTQSASVDNVQIDGNTISTLNTNGDLNLTPNGTGEVNVTNIDVLSGKVPFGTITDHAFAAFSDITDQTGSTTVATPVKFGTTDVVGQGITVVTDGSNLTRLTFAAAGTYALTPNLQITNTDTNDHDLTVWFALEGVNIPRSATKITVPKAADGGNTFFQISIYVTVTAGQYVQVLWLPENTAVRLDHTAAVVGPPAIPAIPSAIMSAERIA